MSWWLPLSCWRFVLLAVGAQAPSAAGAKVVTVIKAGLLLDPQRGVVERNQTILVDDGKVTKVGADVTAPPGSTVIDLTKYTVLPGLMDAHTHLCMDVNLRRDAGSYFDHAARPGLVSCGAGRGECQGDARGRIHDGPRCGQ